MKLPVAQTERARGVAVAKAVVAGAGTKLRDIVVTAGAPKPKPPAGIIATPANLEQKLSKIRSKK